MGKNISRTKRPLGHRDGQRVSIVASLWNKKIPRRPCKMVTQTTETQKDKQVFIRTGKAGNANV